MTNMIENAPALELDKILYARFSDRVPAAVVRERRVVWNLLKHLHEAGFKPISVNDGDDDTALLPGSVVAMKEAMELIFNLDEVHVFFRRIDASKASPHWIFLVLGNDLDVVSDWSFNRSDNDGFNASMEKFNAEDYA